MYLVVQTDVRLHRANPWFDKCLKIYCDKWTTFNLLNVGNGQGDIEYKIFNHESIQPLALSVWSQYGSLSRFSRNCVCPACAAQVRRTGRSTLFHASLPLNHNRQWNLVCLQLLAQNARDRGVSPEKLSVSVLHLSSENSGHIGNPPLIYISAL